MRASSSFVGLDVGSTGIRAAQITRHRRSGELELVRAASVELPTGAMRNGAVADPKAVTHALKALWRRGRFTTRRVAFALSDSGVLTRQVDLPWMPPEDFSAALRYQVGDALPVDLATVELDYHPLDELERKDDLGNPSPVNRILVVAANREAVEALSVTLRKARLEPVIADSSAFALIRAVCGGRLPADDVVRAVADIGGDQLTVIVHQGGQPRFIRSIANLGGGAATHSLEERLSLEWDGAERLKRETGLNGPAPVVVPLAESSVFGSSGSEEPMDPRVLATIGVLNPWATTVVSEIRNSLDYYQASVTEGRVASLDIVGRTVLLDGLLDRIATQIPLPVAVLPPLLGLPASRRVHKAEAPDSRLAVAIGMAMAVSS